MLDGAGRCWTEERSDKPEAAIVAELELLAVAA
jgi:hypothetical protein